MIAFLADVHLANHRRFGGPVKAGVNRRARQILSTLRQAVATAADHGCDWLVVLGDLFDGVKPEPQLIREAQRVFDERLPVTVMVGNHEQVSLANGDNSLGPLGPVSSVIDEPRVWPWVRGDKSRELWLIPFRPGPAVEWLPEVLGELIDQHGEPGEGAALLLHLGLSTDSDPVYLRGSPDSIPVSMVLDLCERHGFEACLSGHWHEHRILHEQPFICQIGALVPNGFRDPGFNVYGKLVLWEGQCWRIVNVPGPRFVRDPAGIDLHEVHKAGHSLYVETTATPDSIADSREWLRGRVEEGVVVAGEVLVDPSVARRAAHDAATVARSADTLDEALAGYVEKMDLPNGVDRDAVLQLVKRYLEAG